MTSLPPTVGECFVITTIGIRREAVRGGANVLVGGGLNRGINLDLDVHFTVYVVRHYICTSSRILTSSSKVYSDAVHVFQKFPLLVGLDVRFLQMKIHCKTNRTAESVS